MDKRMWTLGLLALGLVASVATSRGDVGVSSGSVGGTSVPDTGECYERALCVTLVDSEGAARTLDWIEVYDADEALVVDEAVEAAEWCGIVESEEVLVVVGSADDDATDEATLECGDNTLELSL